MVRSKTQDTSHRGRVCTQPGWPTPELAISTRKTQIHRTVSPRSTSPDLGCYES